MAEIATADDREVIEQDQVPSLIMMDGTHFTKEAYAINARLVKANLDEMQK